MHKGKYIYATIYLILLFSLTGCGSRLSFTARDDGKADMSVLMDTGKAASRMIASIMASLYPSSSDDSGGVFTKERAAALERSLSGGDTEKLTVEALSSSVLSLVGTIKDAASQSGVSRTGIHFSNFVDVKKKSMTLTLSPDTMRTLYDSMDDQTRGYVDLFMAPAFTGETMTGEEYVALIGSVYGKDMADEIASAQMDLTLTAPKGCTISSCSLEDAKLSGRRARFSIPLLDLLVMNEEQSYRINW